jgi:hypothetical protein
MELFVSDKRLPSSLSSEELLGQLDSADDDVLFDVEENDVVTFLTRLKITPGLIPVKKKLIFSYYIKWSHDCVPQKKFSTIVDRYYKTNNEYIFVNQDAFKITKQLKGLHKSKTKYIKNKFALNFVEFLKDKNIVAGTKWIKADILFYYFDQWAFKRKLGSGNKKKLIRITKMFLKIRKTSTKEVWIGVNDGAIPLDVQEKATEWARNRYATKEKQQKKSNKVPRTRS